MNETSFPSVGGEGGEVCSNTKRKTLKRFFMPPKNTYAL